MWLRLDDGLLQGHIQVFSMELALDFESHAGQPLPPTSQTHFNGIEMCLQEKGPGLQLAATLSVKALWAGSIWPVATTTRCRFFVPLGLGTVVAVKGRRIFSRPMTVWHHLQRMCQYSAERCGLQQQARASQRRRKTQQGQAKPPGRAVPTGGQQEHCPRQGWSLRHRFFFY